MISPATSRPARRPSAWLVDGVAAVGAGDGAGDEGGGLAGGGDDAGSDLGGAGVALLGCVVDPVAAEFGAVHGGHLGLDVAGGHRVDADVVGCPLGGEGLGQLVDGGLGGVVGRLPLGAVDDEAGDRADVDDRAAAGGAHQPGGG